MKYYDENYYVPILKWKRGEQKALELIPIEQQNHLMPLLEIPPIPYDYVNEKESKTIDQHVENICEQIKNSWHVQRPIFLDLSLIEDKVNMENGVHPFVYIYENAKEMNIDFIPVTSLNRNTLYNEAVKEIINDNKLGLCVRLCDDDFDDIEETLKGITDDYSIERKDIDLIIDFGYISPKDQNKTAVVAQVFINSIPHLEEWRSLTIAGTSFPETLSSIETGTTGTIPRTEWLIWNQIITKNRTKITPQFGDYCVANPEIIDIDPRFMNMAANIRYTGEEDYIIFRGKSIKRHGGQQNHALSEQVVNHSEYKGKDFCWGDKYIHDCSQKNCSPGNSETWRRVGTNHHLALVISQLSK